jgi:hypothetical protein
MKNILYGTISFLCVTLACCAISLTCCYKSNEEKSIVELKYGTITYRVKVNSVRQACREWAKFPYEYKEAKAYEKEYQELKKKNNRQTEELAETFDWSAFGELGKEMQSLTESESSDSIVESWFDK